MNEKKDRSMLKSDLKRALKFAIMIKRGFVEPKQVGARSINMTSVVFGGAFDPPHSEHVKMCEAAVKELHAERLILVPTYLPPHKSEGFLKYEDRVQLCKLAFNDCADEVVIDDIEQQRKQDNYASEILPILNDKYDGIIYLIGGDSLQYFESWHNPDRVLDVCPIAVAEREGFRNILVSAKHIKDKYGRGNFRFLNYVGKNVASSHIRAQLLLGQKPSGVPKCVWEYIEENSLFNEFVDMVAKVKSYQSEELFEHTCSVVLRAVDLNAMHNLKQDFVKVFIASLLHDNAKQRLSLDGFPISEELIGTKVLHQFLGAEKAKRDFNIQDEDIISAIRYHTTAKADMSVFEKLIYTADSTSYDRKYEPIPRLRRIADGNFEEGFKAVLKHTFESLAQSRSPIYPLTIEAVRYYLG